MSPVRIGTLALVAAAWLFSSAAAAQQYPFKPVRLVVPFSPGGSSDTIARLVGHALTAMWGQQVVVDNRPGAGTIIGSEITSRAPPDGHTIMTANIAFALNYGYRKKLPYDTFRDFDPVILLAQQPTAIVAPAGFPANTLGELIAMAKARPGTIAYGSSGLATVGHLAGELLKTMTGISINHVSYKGGGQLVVDVVSGQIPLGIMGLPPAMPHIRAGRLKAIALTDAKRAGALKEAPVIAETVPGYEVNNWIGLLAPARTPGAVVAKINGDVQKVLAVPEVVKRLSQLGFEIRGSSALEFRNLVHADAKKYQKVMKDAGIVPE